MGSKSTYLKNKVLDHYLGQTAYVQPTPYLGLYTTAPTDAGGGTEVSGGSYARVAAGGFFGSAVSGASANTSDIEFAQATANWGTVKAFGVFDTSSGGNLMLWGYLIQTRFNFTAAVDDTIAAPGHTLVNGDAVIVEGASLPTGLTEGTTYYVINAATNTLKLSLTVGGAAVDITAVGSGTVGKLVPKTIESGDKAIFYTGSLTFTED